MKIACLSNIGRYREVNQDRVNYKKINENEYLSIVCDGMGGHNAGEVAAQLVCDYIMEHFDIHQDFKNEDDIHEWLNELINRSHDVVYAKSQTSSEFEGMGTTVVVSYVNHNDLYISHIGDSRAYLLEDNHLEQLTKDDTLVNALIETGSISKEEALVHPQKNILLQAVGVSSPLKTSFYHYHIDNKLVLICSDGLYNSLSSQQMETILLENLTIEQKVQLLVDEANKYGGKDNIGVVLMQGGNNNG